MSDQLPAWPEAKRFLDPMKFTRIIMRSDYLWQIEIPMRPDFIPGLIEKKHYGGTRWTIKIDLLRFDTPINAAMRDEWYMRARSQHVNINILDDEIFRSKFIPGADPSQATHLEYVPTSQQLFSRGSATGPIFVGKQRQYVEVTEHPVPVDTLRLSNIHPIDEPLQYPKGLTRQLIVSTPASGASATSIALAPVAETPSISQSQSSSSSSVQPALHSAVAEEIQQVGHMSPEHYDVYQTELQDAYSYVQERRLQLEEGEIQSSSDYPVDPRFQQPSSSSRRSQQQQQQQAFKSSWITVANVKSWSNSKVLHQHTSVKNALRTALAERNASYATQLRKLLQITTQELMKRQHGPFRYLRVCLFAHSKSKY